MGISVQRLKRFFVLTVVVSLFFFCCTGYLWYLKFQHYQNLKHIYTENSDKLYQLTTEFDWINANSSYYQKLQKTGNVEKSDSLVWIEMFASVGETLEINNLQFELSPVMVVSRPGGMSTERVEISMRGSMLHDGVLMQLFARLVEQASGAWFYESLDVVRATRAVETSLVDNERVVSTGALDVALRLVWIGFVPQSVDGAVI